LAGRAPKQSSSPGGASPEPRVSGRSNQPRGRRALRLRSRRTRVWIHGYGTVALGRGASWGARGAARRAVFTFGDRKWLHHRPLPGGACSSRSSCATFFRRLRRLPQNRGTTKATTALTGGSREKAGSGRLPGGRGGVSFGPLAPRRAGDTARGNGGGRFGLPDDARRRALRRKMIPSKRPQDLIDAVGLLAGRAFRHGPCWSATGRWTGLENAVAKRQGGLVGARPFRRVPKTRARSPCAGEVRGAWAVNLHEKKDPHPLAVTESMIVANAVVASGRVGCVGDDPITARQGVNALVLPMRGGGGGENADRCRRLGGAGSQERRCGARMWPTPPRAPGPYPGRWNR